MFASVNLVEFGFRRVRVQALSDFEQINKSQTTRSSVARTRAMTVPITAHILIHLLFKLILTVNHVTCGIFYATENISRLIFTNTTRWMFQQLYHRKDEEIPKILSHWKSLLGSWHLYYTTLLDCRYWSYFNRIGFVRLNENTVVKVLHLHISMFNTKVTFELLKKVSQWLLLHYVDWWKELPQHKMKFLMSERQGSTDYSPSLNGSDKLYLIKGRSME